MAKIRDSIAKAAGSKRFQIISLSVLALGVAVGLYFTLNISRQRDYFDNRNLRELKSLSNQISLRVDDLKSGFVSSVQNTLRGAPDGEPDFKKSLKSIQGVTFFDVKQPDVKPKQIGNEHAQSEFARSRCQINLLRDQAGTSLQLTCETVVGEFQARTMLANLISPFFDPTTGHKGWEHEEGFDDILIAKAADRSDASAAAGEVVFDQGTSELAVTSLNNLPLSGSPDKKFDFTSFSQTTNSVSVNIAGDDYKLYVQPLGMNTQNTGSAWVICGLVQASHFRNETWTISYTIVVGLAFLLALVFLSWPFLKILYLGPKDRLRLADIYFVSFALVIGAAMITLFSLWSYSYSRNESHLDHQLEELADSITTNYQQEIQAALGEIEDLNRKREESVAKVPRPSNKSQLAVAESNRPEQVTRVLENIVCKPDIFSRTECLKKEKYPYFQIVFWTDEKGRQTTKWQTNTNKTNVHPVDTRSYFTEVENGHALKMDGKEFWIESTASSVTGAKTVVISRPLHQNSSDGIIAMATNLASVMDAVTPPGFGYRIIDRNGEVLLRSAEAQQWTENFFDESNNDQQLRGTVASRIQKHTGVTYKGRAYSLWVTPLDWSPGWSLIVFRDKQPLRTLYAEMITLAGFFFFGYAFVLLVVFAIFYLGRTSTDQRAEWIWPAADSLSAYYGSIVISLLLCILVGVEVAVSRRGWMLLLVSITAFVGIALFLLRLKLRRVFQGVSEAAQSMHLDQSFGYVGAYVANLVILVVLVAVMPALAFFKVAYNTEMLLYVKHNQINLAEGLKARERRIRDLYSTRRAANNEGPFTDPNLANAMIERRRDDLVDVYAGFFYQTNAAYEVVKDKKAKPPESTARWYRWLDTVLGFFAANIPFFNRMSVELWGLMPNGSADNSWQWLSTSNALTLQIPRDARAGQTALYLKTPLSGLSSMPSPKLATAFLILAFILLVALLWFLTKFIVRKVFLLDFQGRSLLRVPLEGFSKLNQNLFVVLSSPAMLTNSLPGNKSLYWVDVSALNGSDVAQEIESKIAETSNETIVVLNNFERGINDPARCSDTLDLAERLLATNRRVVIVSNAEPSAYHWKHSDGDGKIAFLTIEDRWAEFVGQFMKVYFTESCSADFDQSLSEAESSLKENKTLSKSQKRTAQKSIEVLRAECSPRIFLRRIGEEIIKRPAFQTMQLGEIRRQIGERARLYYGRIWQNCSANEKLTLLHLAQDRLLSPNDPQIDQLFLKGLIICAPDVSLFNETFKHFVMYDCFTGDLASQEDQAKKASPWEKLKLPLSLGLAGVLIFLMITQKDFFGSSLSIITGLTTAIPAVFKLLGFFQSQGTGAKVLSSAAGSLT